MLTPFFMSLHCCRERGGSEGPVRGRFSQPSCGPTDHLCQLPQDLCTFHPEGWLGGPSALWSSLILFWAGKAGCLGSWAADGN